MPSYNLGESAKAAMGELASGQQKAPAFAKPRPEERELRFAGIIPPQPQQSSTAGD